MVETRHCTLVAAWPGMGDVARLAGIQLVRSLDMQPWLDLVPDDYFEPASIRVEQGRILVHRQPRSGFFRWSEPGTGRELLVMVAEAQPPHRAGAYSRALLELAASEGVDRVVTFAAMATQVHPAEDSRVHAASSSADWLRQAEAAGAEPLGEAEIGGMNGLFLAEAARQGLPALGLLGEMPFFAAAIPNPKASAAVLEVFSKLSGFPVDISELVVEGKRIQDQLVGHLEALQRAAEAQGKEAEPAEQEAWRQGQAETGGEEEPGIGPELRQRIEALFAQAAEDRSSALALKAELDRLGLFKHYEDRFLDLFRKGS